MNRPKIFSVFTAKTWQYLFVGFGAFLLPVYGFVELADEVRDKETLVFDEAVLRSVNEYSSPFFDALVIGLTELGGPIGVTVLTVGAVVLLWNRKHRKMAGLLAVGVSGGVLLNLFLKSIFQRDRPQLWERIVTENSYSFPSGHAMASSAFAASVVVAFWPTKYRWFVLVGAVLYMLVIALTRLYLGVHYPTDILAGWLVSIAWVALVVGILANRTRIGALLSRS
jgi:membrane-associated phospholipid phosphatase